MGEIDFGVDRVVKQFSFFDSNRISLMHQQKILFNAHSAAHCLPQKPSHCKIANHNFFYADLEENASEISLRNSFRSDSCVDY